MKESEEDKEIREIDDDIRRLKKFAKDHSHDPKVPKAVEKLIYALIVRKHKIQYKSDEFDIGG